MTIYKVRAPALPLATPEYEQAQQDQFQNVLRLYFNRLDDTLINLSDTSGGAGLSFPYGAFSSGVTQSAASNTATALTFNTTDFAQGFSVVSSSRITPAYSAIYNLQFSVQIQNLSNAPEDVYIWLKQYTASTTTLADITGSTGVVGLLARKNPGDPSHDIKGWNYYVSMAAGDYLQIYWSTTNGTDVTIPYYAASGTPTKPSTQSVVATMSFVSALNQ
jgi:hypothetical protein